MALVLPENVSYIDYSDFSSDGYYSLQPGETKIFPWEVEPSGHTDITLVQTDLNTQDHTVQAWLSHEPLDYVMYPNVGYMNWMDIQRTGTIVSIYDSSDLSSKNQIFRARTKTSYYLNVKNMANEPNSFRVIFSFETGSSTSNNTGDGNTPPYSDVNSGDAVGTHTIYGIVVAQLDDGLTLVDSSLDGFDTYSLMNGDDLVASVKLSENSPIKGIEDIVATFCDGSNPLIQDLNLMMTFLTGKYGILDIQLYDASMDKVFWDTLMKYPGKLKFSLWDKATGKRTVINQEMLDCESLWERDPNLILLIQ